ncbi:MAG: tetratricopeptide repeat protein [Planctomycetales bacterium]
MIRVPALFSKAAWATTAGLAGFLWLAAVAAAEPPAAPEPPPLPATEAEPLRPLPPWAAPGFRLQPADDEAIPLDPRRPRTPADEARVQATALYMKAQLLQSRGDLRAAYETFEKALELDPESAAIRRALVPLAFRMNREEDAVKHALKAIELDPTDHETLRRLGLQFAAQGKLDEGTGLLEKAAASPRLSKTSPTYVSLMRELGILHTATGDTNKAGDAFEILLDALLNPARYELDPDTLDTLQANQAATFERIGQVLLEADRPDRALAAFERAGKLGRWAPATLGFHLAGVRERQGKPDEALAELQKYFDAQLQSKGRAPYELLEKILAAQKKSDELLPRIEALAEKDPHNTRLQLFLADQYLAADRLDDAEQTYRSASKGSADAEGHLGLAAIHRRRNQPAELLQALAQAVQGKRSGEHAERRLVEELEAVTKDEKLLDSLIDAGRERSQGDEPKLELAESLLLAKLAADAERTDAAIEFFRFAMPRAEPRRRIAIHNELGGTLFAAKRYAEAAEAFREGAREPLVVNDKPLRAEFLLKLSRSSELAADSQGALDAIREARKLLPDNPLLHFEEGMIHYRARDWDDAIHVLQEVVGGYPDDPEIAKRALFSISNIHVEKGEFDKGEAILEKFLAENPDDPGVNNDLGYLWADRDKNLDRAERMIRKALAAEPDNAAYLDSMGWVLYRQGKFAEAIEQLEKAVSDPAGSDATIWDHLGDAYEKLGNIDKARHAWEKALEEARDGGRPDEKLIEKIETKLRQRGRVEPPAKE